jgi:ribonuclease PH
MNNSRLNNRNHNQLRAIKITRNYIKYPEGSVLVEFGDTKIICNATVDENVPNFLKDKNQGWLTAEYSMLPRATNGRTKRDGVVGRVNSRASEISRLIGRSLRSCIDLSLLGNRQILIDCDVIQADGGTRTAAITGSFIALADAVNYLIATNKITINPIKHKVAAVSVGVVNGKHLLDLDYREDSNCDSDINVVMLDNLSIVEIQGTAEKNSFSSKELNQLVELAEVGIKQLFELQIKA